MSVETGNRPNSQEMTELARSLLASPEVSKRALLLADAVRRALPESACALYAFRPQDACWALLGASGEVSVVGPAITADAPLFAPLLRPPRPTIYGASQLAREDYAHLQVFRTVRSIGYLPLLREEKLAGVFEIVSFREEITTVTLRSLESIADLAVAALGAAKEFEQQRQDLLDSIHRLTQLYDLEKSLNETLEFEHLQELIVVKVAAMLPCQAVHLRMFDDGHLTIVSTWGEDTTAAAGTVEGAGEGHVGDMAEAGVALLIDDPKDPRLILRNQRSAGGRIITNTLLVPLIERDPESGGESEIGVLEAINKSGDQPFNEDDLFFMNSMSETVSSALKNASLMHAERKLEILQALVTVSSEITSTLRLDRLLQIIVNSPQPVLPFERCSIALDNRGRLQLKAISGMSSIPAGDVQVERLRKLLQWLAIYDKQLLVRQHEDGLDNDDESVRAPISMHFAASGYRALFALPLSDDQGRVGLLLYESSNADFLEQAHIEMIKVLAGQTTISIRNALLYREVPLIGLLEPLMQRKQTFLRSERKRQGIIVGTIVAAILLLAFCPLPLRISGKAAVAPESVITIVAATQGTIAKVFAREGQQVHAGEVLGTMDDWLWRSQLTAAQAKYELAMQTMQGHLARHSAQAGEDRTQADYLQAEMEHARLRIANAQLKSPIDGIVMTPNLQNAAGGRLEEGATFAQVLNLTSARINIAVDQADANLIRVGQEAAVKLDSYPTQTFRGQVFSISPEARAAGDSRVFYAYVLLPNRNAILRPGMDGRARISAGYRPAGFVLLRSPALWIWQKLWDWIGW